MVNFLATLGWNDGTEQEVFTTDELIKTFSLDRVQKSPARFDEQRFLWLNGQHIRALSLEELSKRVEPFWPESARSADPEYRLKVLSLAQDRLKTLADLPALTQYFFEEPAIDWSLVDGNKQLKKLSPAQQKELLQAALDVLASQTDWSAASIQETLNQLLEKTGQKPGILFSLVRIATTWAPFSPALDETLAILGKETVQNRLTQAVSDPR